MNTGKTRFAQRMEFPPWSRFGRIVARYDGDRAVRTLTCAANGLAHLGAIPVGALAGLCGSITGRQSARVWPSRLA